jgi:hypothetical protein
MASNSARFVFRGKIRNTASVACQLKALRLSKHARSRDAPDRSHSSDVEAAVRTNSKSPPLGCASAYVNSERDLSQPGTAAIDSHPDLTILIVAGVFEPGLVPGFFFLAVRRRNRCGCRASFAADPVCLYERLDIAGNKSNGFANFNEREPPVSHPVVDRPLVVIESPGDGLFAPQLLYWLNLLLIILHFTIRERRVKTFPFPILKSLTIPQIAVLAGCSRRTMLKIANAGEIPADIVNPGRTMRRYADTPRLRQWCNELNINNQVGRQLRRQASPRSVDAVRFIQRLHRAKIDFHRLRTRRPLRTWSLFELDQLLKRLEYIETMRIPVEAWMDQKRRSEEKKKQLELSFKRRNG